MDGPMGGHVKSRVGTGHGGQCGSGRRDFSRLRDCDLLLVKGYKNYYLTILDK